MKLHVLLGPPLKKAALLPQMNAPHAPFTLEKMDLGIPGIIHSVETPANSPEWKQWLEEIGFIAGEQVQLMARGMPGGDPLMVRIGTSTFALRRAEAACISVLQINRDPQ